jgi:hypothetical protein
MWLAVVVVRFFMGVWRSTGTSPLLGLGSVLVTAVVERGGGCGDWRCRGGDEVLMWWG